MNNEDEGSKVAIDGTQKPSKKRGKAMTALAVIAVIVVLAFGGGGVVYITQHSSPQFCNAICHDPMDPYVQSYTEGTSVNAQQANADCPLGVTIHKESSQDIVCVTCHTDGIDTQLQEGLTWIAGNYSQPLKLTLTVREPNAPHQKSGVETCLNAGCHEGISSLNDLKQATSDLTRNPHDSHNGDQNCSTCHQMHEQSIMTCTQCHADAEVPDGWLTFYR